MEFSKEFLDKYGFPTIEQYRENMIEGESEIDYYQQILDMTDYIPHKIFESFIEDMANASVLETIGVIVNFFKDIKVTYGEVLTIRKYCREEINKLQSEIY